MTAIRFPHNLTDTTLTVVIRNKPYVVLRTSANWDKVKAALVNPKTTEEELLALVSPVKAIEQATQDHKEITIKNGRLYYGDEEVHNALADRVLDVIREGLPVESWVNFARNVYANPSEFAREELYGFLERSNIPITPDGCFLPYKKVSDDYSSFADSSFKNTIGSKLSMPREEVDDNRHRTCSRGLHFCSKEYLPKYHYGRGRVVILKVNPKDVVSIPTDYNLSKGRACAYEVVGEIEESVAMTKKWAAVEEIPSKKKESKKLTVTTTSPVKSVKTKSKKAITIATSQGTLSRKRFRELVQKHGTMAAVARSLGVAPSTVRDWKQRLYS